MLELPRSVSYSKEDSQSIETFRKTLLLNKFRHHQYNPSLDNIFGRCLYEGLCEEAELAVRSSEEGLTDRIPTVSDFIVKN